MKLRQFAGIFSRRVTGRSIADITRTMAFSLRSGRIAALG